MNFLFVFFLLFILNCACGISYIPRSSSRKINRHPYPSIQKETCTCLDENGKNFTFVKNVNETHEKMTSHCECVIDKREPDWFSFTFFIAFIIAMFCI